MDMNKEDIAFLNQMVLSLEESEKKLEDAYRENNSTEFNKSKRLILRVQAQIRETLK